MQPIRSLALVACALLAGCTFEVAGITSTGDSQPGGGIAAPSADGGATATVDGAPAPSGPISPAPPAPTPAPTAHYGAACDGAHPCTGGLVCWHQIGIGPKAPMLPGGYCTSDCSQTPCQDGASCVDFGGGLKLCMADCPPASCRNGYSCCDAGNEVSACLPGDQCPGG